MAKRLLFVPITKVDLEKREVWGRAVEEILDKSGEIFDYASSAPLFQAWSAEFEKATDGKSFGNIRAMHGKVAAGKVIAIDFADADKAIDIGTKIVDDTEWTKVAEGVYTGFSIGGEYVRKWQDDTGLTRYTANPSEISIVDNPCVPTARFTVVKADGSTEEHEFHPEPAEPIRKGLWSVSRLASLLDDVRWMASDEAWDATIEGDGSTIPAQLAGWLAQGITILSAMVTEEGAEAIADLPATAAAAAAGSDVALATGTGDVAKAETPAAETPAPTPAPNEAPVLDGALFAKRVDDIIAERVAATLQKIEQVTAENAALVKRVEQLEAQPAAPKGFLRAVTKAQDNGAIEPLEIDVEKATPIEMMKHAHARPLVIAGGA